MNGINYFIRPGRILKVFLFGLLIVPSLLMSQEEIEKMGSDPLQNAIRTDSSEVNALLKKSEDLRFSNPDSAVILARRAIELADNINFEVAKACLLYTSDAADDSKRVVGAGGGGSF